MDIRLLALGALIAIVPVLYMYTASIMQTRLPMLRNKRICLLIAHPDDEAMFFTPTVLALTRPETGNMVKILCLSTGNAKKLGETRRQELKKSAVLLGLRDEEDVFVIDNEHDYPDSMTAKWDRTKIATLLCEAFAPDLAAQREDPTIKPTVTTDVIVTFDSTGISSHPNHQSLYHGARTFIAMLTWGKKDVSSPVDLYTLTSINILRKYSWFLDLPTTLFGWWTTKQEADAPLQRLVFTNSLFGEAGYGAARKAMTDAHLSQMVWFRHAWILLSRYMYINDLRLEKVESE